MGTAPGHTHTAATGAGARTRATSSSASSGKCFVLRSYFQLFLFQGVILCSTSPPCSSSVSGIRKISPGPIISDWLSGSSVSSSDGRRSSARLSRGAGEPRHHHRPGRRLRVTPTTRRGDHVVGHLRHRGQPAVGMDRGHRAHGHHLHASSSRNTHDRGSWRRQAGEYKRTSVFILVPSRPRRQESPMKEYVIGYSPSSSPCWPSARCGCSPRRNVSPRA